MVRAGASLNLHALEAVGRPAHRFRAVPVQATRLAAQERLLSSSLLPLLPLVELSL